jgi:ATP-dependent phosphofructokinase / diphosphate-dependent phosphofructokinase
MRKKKIGVLTGGGDVPGLNPCMKMVVMGSLNLGYEVIGIRRGWAGLLELNLDDPENIEKNIRPLKRQDVRTIDRTGGTFLHTSRTNPQNVSQDSIPDFLLDSAKRKTKSGEKHMGLHRSCA